MQIGPLSFPRLHPRPRASIVLRARMNPYQAEGKLERARGNVLHMYERPLRVSILIIIYAVARGSDIIIVRAVGYEDSIDEDYAGYSARGTKPFRGPALYLASREH